MIGIAESFSLRWGGGDFHGNFAELSDEFAVRHMRFEEAITIENIYDAWIDFSAGKQKKEDVMVFESNLENELVSIANDLQTGRYTHSPYSRFVVHDPKRRIVHKATVRDRVVHRILYNSLMPVFHPRWLNCSFSCRPGFGQHRSVEAVRMGLRQATRNRTRECFTLKVDVKRYFDSMDHGILLSLLSRRVTDDRWMHLLDTIIGSFCVDQGTGVPIGNLTSQLFANVYLHELDWFVKHELRHHWYYRYADDMLFLCETKDEIKRVLTAIGTFLSSRLSVHLHPNKTIIRKNSWGVDWLGRVLLPGHEVLRPSTQRRMLRRVDECAVKDDSHRLFASLASFNGLLNGTARRKLDERLLQTMALAGRG